MKNEITAIFVVALIAFGGVGFTTAMPKDLVGFDTPDERAVKYELHLAQLEADMTRMGVAHVNYRMENVERRYEEKLGRYTRMYNYINVTELTTSPTGNSSWSKIGCGVEGAPQTYVQGLVATQIAKVEAFEMPSAYNIQTNYEVLLRLTTYPGGPVYIRYECTVTWSLN